MTDYGYIKIGNEFFVKCANYTDEQFHKLAHVKKVAICSTCPEQKDCAYVMTTTKLRKSLKIEAHQL